MDLDNSRKVLTAYMYRTPTSPLSWFRCDYETGKEEEVERPFTSYKLKKEIEEVADIIKSTDFWKKDCFASVIKFVCDMDNQCVLLVHARKNHLAFQPFFDRNSLKWYKWDAKSEKGPEEHKEIVDGLMKSSISERIEFVSFGEREGKFSIIEIVNKL